MEFIKEIFFENSYEIFASIIMIVATVISVLVKQLFERFVKGTEKMQIVRNCVNMVEQVFVELHGKDKFEAAYEKAATLLSEKGIKVSSAELETLIEAVVGEFNGVFKKDKEGAV